MCSLTDGADPSRLPAVEQGKFQNGCDNGFYCFWNKMMPLMVTRQQCGSAVDSR